MATPQVGRQVAECFTHVSKIQQVKPHVKSRQADDTVTSDSAPAWMTTLNAAPIAERPEWDWITYNRYAGKRKALNDDTMTSMDAPEWFHTKSRADKPPALTSRYQKYVAFGGKQVLLKPLVDVPSAENGGQAHLLHPVKSSAGYIPEADVKARLDGTQPAWNRIGRTTATIIGCDPSVQHEFTSRRPRTSDRLGVTSAADLDHVDGPIVDPFGGTAQSGEAFRRQDRARSVGARMNYTSRMLGETVGGAADGLPVRDLPGGHVLVREAPHSTYYAWRKAGIPEDVVHGATGLNRGKVLQPGLAGHAKYYHMVNTFADRPGKHLGALQAGLQTQTLKRTGGLGAQKVNMREAPYNWYATSR